jgi:hypothetical protein
VPAIRPQIQPPSLPLITATGARGYLQWLRADQPGLYQRVLPQLRAAVPQLWSDAIQSRVTTNLGRMMGRLGVIGQDDDDSDDDDTSIETLPSADVIQPIDTSLDVGTVPELQDDDADNADTTAIDPSTAGTVSSIVGQTLIGAVDTDLAGTVNQLSDSQLQNATAGLAPSATGASGLGQTFSTLSSSLGTTGLLLLGGGLLLLVALVAE